MASTKQKEARDRNWALFTITGCIGNIEQHVGKVYTGVKLKLALRLLKSIKEEIRNENIRKKGN